MFREKYRIYINWGVTVLAIIAVSLLFYFFMLRFDAFTGFVGRILGALAPFTWGIVIAFVLDSLVVVIARLLEKLPHGKREITSRRRKVYRGIGIVAAELVFLAFLAVMVQSIVPQLTDSLKTLVSNFGRYRANLDKWVQGLLEDYPAALPYYERARESLGDIEKLVGDFIQNDLLRVASSGLMGAGTTLYRFIIGLIVSIYMLMSKQHLLAMFKKLTYAWVPRQADRVVRLMQHTVRVFKGFFVGKLLDSLIIGILCFIGTLILGIPYPLLISIIVGVTNIIPSFGPIIGAVPSAFLVLIVDPMKCLIFVIFIIVLQQLDGNVIGPKILGNSTGVSSLGVLFSIVLGGGLMGVTGMIVSVPTYAVIYGLIKKFSERRLKAREMPVKTEDYIDLQPAPEAAEEPAAPEKPEAPAKKGGKRA